MLAQNTDESFRADHVRFRNAGSAVVQVLMRSDFFATEAFFCDHDRHLCVMPRDNQDERQATVTAQTARSLHAAGALRTGNLAPRHIFRLQKSLLPRCFDPLGGNFKSQISCDRNNPDRLLCRRRCSEDGSRRQPCPSGRQRDRHQFF
jgi:hypothetical protein